MARFPSKKLDTWVSEGRVTAEALLNQGRSTNWVLAQTIYPTLVSTEPAGTTPFETSPTSSTNPYTSPVHVSSPVRRYARPHRGGVILTLGLVGLLCCPVVSPVAWALGYADMKAIDAGRMDPAGRSTTQVDMILGIVGSVMLLFGVGVQILMAVLSLAT